ncbi:hypothetical protein C8R45DRAFT_1107511 [Mycena sanguinolenta]|nr:hypothetical protein C8R45DRAFT_1107511 [Mycena sanguinolenta]
MATRSSSPLVVLATTNSLKRALSEDQDSDDASHPDPKKIKLKQGNTPQKDKKKRRKKKKKTPVVLELTTSTNAAPASSNPQVEPLTPTALRSPMDSGKGKRKATSDPAISALQLEANAGRHSGEDAESSSAARARSPSPGAEESLELPADGESSLATIARLNDELKAQSILLKKHETTLNQFTQSLTCQVCLDLLHKPFALAPCGHVACYNCLVAWFTSEPEEHYMGPRKKTCPNCRATIKERPVEVWNIKELVAGLLKSGLASGLSAGPSAPPPLPGSPQPADAPPDPWHNIFRYPHQHPMFHPPPQHGEEPPSVEDMGMLDAEDGVYRCLDCMHEIWDGICTSCQREYPGHIIEMDDGDDGEMFGDSDGDGDEEPIFWPHFLQAGIVGPVGQWWNADDDDEDEDESELERAIQDAEDGYDSFIDDDEAEDVHRAAAIIEINDSDDERGSSPPPVTRRRGVAPVNSRIVISSDEEEEDIPDPPSRRRRNRNRISSPVENEVIVVSGDESDDGDAISRRSQSTINDDENEEDEEESQVSDNESNARSSTYNRGTAPMTAGDLIHLMRRFQDGDEDSQDGSARGYQSDDY